MNFTDDPVLLMTNFLKQKNINKNMFFLEKEKNIQ